MKHNDKTGANPARRDTLTFAVIWDPKNGLEAFPCAHLFEKAPADVSDADRDLFDCWSRSDESVSTQSDEEPFAVFGSRQLHYIDIRSSKMYKDMINEKFSRASSQSSASNYSRDSWRNPSCFLDKSLANALPANRESLDSFFPLWNGSEAEPDRSVELLKPEIIDDEGFFDLSSHADCDPHLPSRFSISTTSTSAYVAVDPNVSGPTTPMALYHRPAKPSNSRVDAQAASPPGADDREPAARAHSGASMFPARSSPQRMSRLTKFLPPWMKRRDERWVLVEVQAVLLERFVEN